MLDRPPVPHGLGVRISDFHSDGPGSIPGVGGLFHFPVLNITVIATKKHAQIDDY